MISPRLLASPPDDPELRFVAFTCVCRRRAAEAGLTDRVAGDLLEGWARHALIDVNDLSKSTHISSAPRARRPHVPTNQIVHPREELEEGVRRPHSLGSGRTGG
jgi:hypothetical protein